MSNHSPKTQQTNQQLHDLKSRKIVLAGAAIFVLIFLVLGGLLLFQGGLTYLLADRSSANTAQPMSADKVPYYQRISLQAMRDSENAKLQSYGWVDRQAGVVRIPIDQAINILLDRGYPTRDRISSPTLASETHPLEDIL